MSRFNVMPRAYRRQLQAEDAANVERAIGRNTYDEAYGPPDEKRYTTSLPGDTRKLRGIPAVGRNVRGAIPGSVPGEELWR